MFIVTKALNQIIYLLIIFLLLCNQVYAASFNCVKARTNVEIAICSVDYLSDLDEKLSIIYNNYINSLIDNSEKKHARTDAMLALKKRDMCNNISCIRNWYDDRIRYYEELLNFKSNLEIIYTTDYKINHNINNAKQRIIPKLSIDLDSQPDAKKLRNFLVKNEKQVVHLNIKYKALAVVADLISDPLYFADSARLLNKKGEDKYKKINVFNCSFYDGDIECVGGPGVYGYSSVFRRDQLGDDLYDFLFDEFYEHNQGITLTGNILGADSNSVILKFPFISPYPNYSADKWTNINGVLHHLFGENLYFAAKGLFHFEEEGQNKLDQRVYLKYPFFSFMLSENNKTIPISLLKQSGYQAYSIVQSDYQSKLTLGIDTLKNMRILENSFSFEIKKDSDDNKLYQWYFDFSRRYGDARNEYSVIRDPVTFCLEGFFYILPRTQAEFKDPLGASGICILGSHAEVGAYCPFRVTHYILDPVDPVLVN